MADYNRQVNNIAAQAQAMLNRLSSEGITNSAGQQTHTYNQGNNTFTPVSSPVNPPSNNYTPPATTTPPVSVDPNAPSINRTASLTSSRIEDTLISSLYTPEKQDEIRKKFLDAVQPWVDTINSNTNLLVEEQNQIKQEQLGRARAGMARGGLIGGMEDTRVSTDIANANLRKEQEIRNTQQQKVLEVQNEMRKLAEEDIRNNANMALKASEQKFSKENTAKLTEASLANTEANIEATKQATKASIEALKTANQKKAADMIETLGKQNVRIDQVPLETLNSFMEFTGLSKDVIEVMLNDYADKANKIDYKWTFIGDKMVGIGTDPKTGLPVRKDVAMPTGTGKALEGFESTTLDNGIRLYYKTDANGKMIPGTEYMDSSIYQTILKLKKQYETPKAGDDTNKIGATTLQDLSIASANNKWDNNSYQKILSWVQTGSATEVQVKEGLLLKAIKNKSIKAEAVMSELGIN